MNTPYKVKGFTLVEVLLVVAILGILAVLVIPSYTKYTLKSNRAEAYSALNEIMQAQERYAADNGTYTIDLTQMGYSAAQASDNNRFLLSASTCPNMVIQRCVLITATAQGRQTSDKNDANGTNNIPITLNTAGERTGW